MPLNRPPKTQRRASWMWSARTKRCRRSWVSSPPFASPPRARPFALSLSHTRGAEQSLPTCCMLLLHSLGGGTSRFPGGKGREMRVASPRHSLCRFLLRFPRARENAVPRWLARARSSESDDRFGKFRASLPRSRLFIESRRAAEFRTRRDNRLGKRACGSRDHAPVPSSLRVSSKGGSLPTRAADRCLPDDDVSRSARLVRPSARSAQHSRSFTFRCERRPRLAVAAAAAASGVLRRLAPFKKRSGLIPVKCSHSRRKPILLPCRESGDHTSYTLL